MVVVKKTMFGSTCSLTCALAGVEFAVVKETMFGSSLTCTLAGVEFASMEMTQ